MVPKTSTLHVLVLSTLAMLLATVTANAQPENPTASTTSATMGKQSFRSYCASCHGTEGRGDGSVAEYLKVPPADLTTISQRNSGEFPFEQVYQAIDGRTPKRSHGSRDMPVWGDAFKMTRDNPDEEGVKKKISELVHFLESIQQD
ncbi:MAG: c-type cytochrome [Acidobacteriota bacterium]